MAKGRVDFGVARDSKSFRAILPEEDYIELRRLALLAGVPVATYIGQVLSAHVEAERNGNVSR